MRVSGVTLGVSLLLLAAACHKSEEETEVTPRVPVGTAVTTTDSISDVVTVIGRLSASPGGAAQLTAPAPAVVRSIAVQMGARVRTGTPLLQLDAPDLLASARSTAAQADLAERDATRQKELFAQGIVSQKQADEKAAEATAARAAANGASALLARMNIRSPIAGVVQAVSVHQGERVDAGKELVEVINGSSLDLLGQVPAGDLARLKVGQRAVVMIEGTSSGAPAKVAALAPAVDSLTNAGQAIVRLPNPFGTLRPGASARAEIQTGKQRQVLVIPDSALVVLGDSMSVFVVGADSIAHARSVSVGVRRAGRAEIVRGLNPGERVVTTGAFGLSDGMHVVLTSGTAASVAPAPPKP
jgi:membrane fusion protein (multidrug efflux system)